jgi:uncharacterized protein YigE (DUF2233 family)
MRRSATLAVLAGTLGLTASGAPPARGGETLAVRVGGGWVTWWQPAAGSRRGGAPLADHIDWRPGADGIEWGEVQLRGAGEAWRTRVVVARMDPRRTELSLDPAFTRDHEWTVGDAAEDVALAFDAGQFRGSLPWGWVLTGGKEILSPQFAPLAGAVIVDSSGAVRLVAPGKVAEERARGTAREAFQSYPMLLDNGVVPAPLREPGLGVNIAHRDARLALGTLPDGRITIALTRFDAFGAALGRVPFGLTAQEMAAVMEALGCRDALLLDGGISGQMLLRDAAGSVRTWPGARSVPMGLVVRSNP